MSDVPPGASGTISLLTDFGLDDPFVGLMKAVIWGRHRSATIVDLCHGIRPGRIQEAAFWIERCYSYFAPGTVHVAVVDPGVGGPRRPVVMRADDHYFVGPDNGLFSGIALKAARVEVRAIDLEAVGLGTPSRTFHGRDVFAPVAAELCSGRLAFEALGERTALGVGRLGAPVLISEQAIDGEVVVVDRFGNLFTNIGAELVDPRVEWEASIEGERCALLGTYGDVEPGERLALVNAFGVIEIAVREGSAAEHFDAGTGTPVRLLRRQP